MAESVLQVARLAARAGGDVVARYFRDGVTMRSKESYNLVSDADVESEEAIAQVVRGHFPDHALMGEETHQADAAAEQLWIIDPLDGTNNFAHGIEHFAVSVAYYQGGEPQCGVVYNPLRDDWFEASRGQGATHNGRALRVSPSDSLQEVLLGVGFFYDRGAMMEATLAAIGDFFRAHVHGVRRFGTASLDLAHVAAGRFGGFFEFELAPWDFAAGRLVLEEAGGRITTCGGNPLPLSKSSILASNGRLHEEMLAIIAPHFAVSGKQ
ncbi:MAG: inositol monophosphatase family protein [Pirellulaceae bacterium]